MINLTLNLTRNQLAALVWATFPEDDPRRDHAAALAHDELADTLAPINEFLLAVLRNYLATTANREGHEGDAIAKAHGRTE